MIGEDQTAQILGPAWSVCKETGYHHSYGTETSPPALYILPSDSYAKNPN
ncbi:hypothetical protein AGABI1DRAFT_124808 [Agaricus bisporus var. burnettii JB137-S8]|uniref:Uncharacterized protein n=1 Tax=Agaricus bisporus var. burnettii (strain JB137-S8 / ATCC MYA-4627 / FGSC 10392) TaxID=597362 RepID=K5XFX9_AGABU|nr:uncharacterized protein AGABI1DRAFT_124808 [Agaricus bisporus var. burnettii JB137-S8]EKM82328.1 hypothetical protein AGABI1DRAFT_124808 [Agaricus bisporus var. burnettii JB137-S8]